MTEISSVECSARPVAFVAAPSVSTLAAATPTIRIPKIAKRDYWGEIDYFAVYCRESGGFYLVPFAEVPVKRQGALRVEPPRNGQVRLIRLARNYELCRVEISTSSS
jgi:hypothetical protein